MTGQQITSLPGGAQLAPGETPLVGDRFMFSTIAFFLHTELVLTNRRLVAMRPHVVLGLIAVGSDRANYPIENIAGISARIWFDVFGILFGVVALLVGGVSLVIPHLAPLGLVLLLLGLAVIIGAPKQALEVMNSGGGVIRFPVSVFERQRTVEFANRVSEALARTSPRGGQASGAFETGPAAASAGDALRRLGELRDQGLITEGEYGAKRTEILARL